jgi:arginine:ornithine antiporter/lysine permease
MATEAPQKLSPEVLPGMVVGSMVGAGIFSLPRTFGPATGPFGAIVASIIAVGGMYMLARVSRQLAETVRDQVPRLAHACVWEIQ